MTKIYENDCNSIRALEPREVGHDTRVKSIQEYLSPGHNINKLFKTFIKLY